MKDAVRVVDGSVERFVSQDEIDKAESDLRYLAKNLSKQIEVTYWELGKALYEVYDGVPGGYRDLLKGEGAKESRRALFEKWGYASFEDYCEKEVGILRRSASNLRYAYYWFEINLTLTTDEKAKIKTLGRSKVYLLSGFVDKENLDLWLDKAAEMTHEELKKAIKSAKAVRATSEDSDGGLFDGQVSEPGADGGRKPAPAPETTHTLTTSLYDGQWDTWQSAFDRAKGVTGSDKIGHNLEMICLDFLASNDFADPKDDLKRTIAKFEKLIGKKIIAIDPKSGKPEYGGDLLWMMVKERAAAENGQSTTADASDLDDAVQLARNVGDGGKASKKKPTLSIVKEEPIHVPKEDDSDESPSF